jgi:hypothetical protein
MKTKLSFIRQGGYIAAHLLILFLDNLATTEILEQVERICSIARRLKAKKLACSRFSGLWSTKHWKAEESQLKGYTIGVSVLGKDHEL